MGNARGEDNVDLSLWAFNPIMANSATQSVESILHHIPKTIHLIQYLQDLFR